MSDTRNEAPGDRFVGSSKRKGACPLLVVVVLVLFSALERREQDSFSVLSIQSRRITQLAGGSRAYSEPREYLR